MLLITVEAFLDTGRKMVTPEFPEIVVLLLRLYMLYVNCPLHEKSKTQVRLQCTVTKHKQVIS